MFGKSLGQDLDSGIPRPRGQLARKAERMRVNVEVALRRSGQLNYRVHAYDISRFGCKIEFVERPELDERVWVKFDGLEPMEALVCWVDGFIVGLEFVRSIHPAVFDTILPRLR